MGTTLPSCSRSVAGVGSRAPLIGRGPTIANTTTPPSAHISGGNYRHKLLKSLCAAVNFESLSDQLNCPGIRSNDPQVASLELFDQIFEPTLIAPALCLRIDLMKLDDQTMRHTVHARLSSTATSVRPPQQSVTSAPEQ